MLEFLKDSNIQLWQLDDSNDTGDFVGIADIIATGMVGTGVREGIIDGTEVFVTGTVDGITDGN